MELNRNNIKVLNTPQTLLEGFKHIVDIARVYYNAEAEKSWQNAIEKLAMNNHAIFEHYQFYIEYDSMLYPMLYKSDEGMAAMAAVEENKHSTVTFGVDRTRIYTNMRVILEYHKMLFISMIEHAEDPDNLREIWGIKIKPSHSLTVKFTCNYALCSEIMRDCGMSFVHCIENFDEIEFNISNKIKSERLLHKYIKLYENCEEVYNELIEDGVEFQIAKDVLPISLQSTLIVTGSPKYWGKFIKLKTDSSIHPDLKELILNLKQYIDNNELFSGAERTYTVEGSFKAEVLCDINCQVSAKSEEEAKIKALKTYPTNIIETTPIDSNLTIKLI